MSQQTTRPNAIRIFLTTEMQLAISKLSAKMDTPSLNAVLYAINEGLKGYVPKDVYEKQKKRFSRTVEELLKEKKRKEKEKERRRREREKERELELEIKKRSLELREQQRVDKLNDEIDELKINLKQDQKELENTYGRSDETEERRKTIKKRIEKTKGELWQKQAERDGLLKKEA